MIRRPFFKYAGSKWLLSKHYQAPKYDTIIEPFAGSACYATRHHERNVILFEKDQDIATLWLYLINADGNEISKLPTTQLQPGMDIRELDVPYGAQLLIRQWQRVGMSNCWTVSKWCNKPGLWGNAARDSVAENVEKIRHWKAFWVDALQTENLEATWFIDPPYQGLPLYGSKTMDFGRLASWCQSRRGQVIVCEQASATWLPFAPFRDVVTGRRGQGCSRGNSKEGIWTNA